MRLNRIFRAIIDALSDAGCELRGDAEACAADARIRPVTDDDWTTEYLDAILSVRIVDGIDAAIEHIAEYGSGPHRGDLRRGYGGGRAFLSRSRQCDPAA